MMIRSDTRKKLAEEAERRLAESIDRLETARAAGKPTSGTVRVGRTVVPAIRQPLGDVLVEHLGVWHTVPAFVALTFKERTS